MTGAEIVNELFSHELEWNRNRKDGMGKSIMDIETTIRKLSKLDPVYGPIWSVDKEGKRISIRKCALCRAEGHHNQENVLHERDCPWIAARILAKEMAIVTEVPR